MNKIAKDGWNAFGHPVPSHRRQKAYETVKEILPKASTELAYSIVAKSAEFVHRDQPFKIVGAVEDLDEDLKEIDLTGRYRLLSVLLVS